MFEFDETNNPEGGVRGTINFNQPAENIGKAKTKWTENNIETVDCMEDIQQMLEAAQDKSILDRILVSPSRIAYMCRTKKMKQMIHGTDKSSRIVQLKDINDYMESNGYPLFEKLQ